VPVCIPGEEELASEFERIRDNDREPEGHRLWVHRNVHGDVHIVVHLVDWSEAVGHDEFGLDEEKLPRYQVSVVGVTADPLAPEWLQPGVAPSVAGAADRSRNSGDARQAARQIRLGLGSLVWVREGNDAGRLLRLASDAANRQTHPTTTYLQDGRAEATRQPGATASILTICQ
jgi:hypothetical protein